MFRFKSLAHRCQECFLSILRSSLQKMIHLSKSDFLTEFSLLGKIIHFTKRSGNLHTKLQTNFFGQQKY